MNNNETFKMTYSAQQHKEVEEIRNKYMEQPKDKMDRLRELDESVTKKPLAIALTIGIIGTLILGLGMSFIMSDFGKLLGNLAFPIGMATGVVGIILLACAYPLYKKILKKERKKITPEILRLTDELMK